MGEPLINNDEAKSTGDTFKLLEKVYCRKPGCTVMYEGKVNFIFRPNKCGRPEIRFKVTSTQWGQPPGRLLGLEDIFKICPKNTELYKENSKPNGSTTDSADAAGSAGGAAPAEDTATAAGKKLSSQAERAKADMELYVHLKSMSATSKQLLERFNLEKARKKEKDNCKLEIAAHAIEKRLESLQKTEELKPMTAQEKKKLKRQRQKQKKRELQEEKELALAIKRKEMEEKKRQRAEAKLVKQLQKRKTDVIETKIEKNGVKDVPATTKLVEPETTTTNTNDVKEEIEVAATNNDTQNKDNMKVEEKRDEEIDPKSLQSIEEKPEKKSKAQLKREKKAKQKESQRIVVGVEPKAKLDEEKPNNEKLHNEKLDNEKKDNERLDNEKPDQEEAQKEEKESDQRDIPKAVRSEKDISPLFRIIENCLKVDPFKIPLEDVPANVTAEEKKRHVELVSIFKRLLDIRTLSFFYLCGERPEAEIYSCMTCTELLNHNCDDYEGTITALIKRRAEGFVRELFVWYHQKCRAAIHPTIQIALIQLIVMLSSRHKRAVVDHNWIVLDVAQVEQCICEMNFSLGRSLVQFPL